jgi:cytidine deaminase
VLREFVPNDADLIVVVEGGEGSIQIPLSSLLPLSFGPENLRHT